MLRTALGLVVLLALQNPPVPPTVPGTSVFTARATSPAKAIQKYAVAC